MITKAVITIAIIPVPVKQPRRFELCICPPRLLLHLFCIQLNHKINSLFLYQLGPDDLAPILGGVTDTAISSVLTVVFIFVGMTRNASSRRAFVNSVAMAG